MKKVILITIVLILMSLLMSPLVGAKELKANLLLTSQLNEWCMSSDGMKQQFCQAYLFGVYETTDCKFKQQSPDFIELKTTFVTWVFSMKEKGFVYALEAALAAFKRQYDCQ